MKPELPAAVLAAREARAETAPLYDEPVAAHQVAVLMERQRNEAQLHFTEETPSDSDHNAKADIKPETDNDQSTGRPLKVSVTPQRHSKKSTEAGSELLAKPAHAEHTAVDPQPEAESRIATPLEREPSALPEIPETEERRNHQSETVLLMPETVIDLWPDILISEEAGLEGEELTS
ncbi:MAG TPA: hypothetical protein VFH39_01900, partial [Candidatus Saccharimonadales bacterium]|nr:hypothetical protein [Candidatus Saccharimonadales bacterium]